MDATPQAPDTFHLYFDSRNARQIRAASLSHAFDLWSQIGLVDRRTHDVAASPTRLELHAPDGQALTGYLLFVRIVRFLRLLWPIALLTWIPGVSIVGNAMYPPSGKKK